MASGVGGERTEARRILHWMNSPLTAIFAASVLLFFLTGIVLSRGEPLTPLQSGIYDLDVRSVVKDAIKSSRGEPLGKHPLFRFLVYPLTHGANKYVFGGDRPQLAVQTIALIAMALNIMLAAWLVGQVCRRDGRAMLLVAMLCGVSFSSILLGSVPDSASFSGFTTLLPLVFLGARRDQPFDRREAVGWGLIGVLGFGLTVTQIVPTLIALGARVWPMLRGQGGLRVRQSWLARRLLASAGVFLIVFAIGVGTILWRDPKSYLIRPKALTTSETRFTRIEDILTAPMVHTKRFAKQILFSNQVAPFPVESRFLITDFNLNYVSLSSEDAGAHAWNWFQCGLLAMLAAFYLVALRRGRFDARFAAPALVLAGQFGLHYIYGREYVLYSPNFHGLMLALLVAATWRGLRPAERNWLFGAGVAFASLTLLNNVLVLSDVYQRFAEMVATTPPLS